MTEKNNTCRVIVSSKAKQMLVSHVVFSAEYNEEAAENPTVEFVVATQSLHTLSHRFLWFTGKFVPKNAYRKLLLKERYLLIYQI